MLGLAAGAQAQVTCSGASPYEVPHDWTLKPSGLSAGDNFRLLFVTSTRGTATATDIATYNTFVQTRAKAGHRAITDSCGNLFKVVGSTSAVDARDNTSTTGTGEAIYWLNGNKVADNYADFYDSTWDSYVGKTEAGTQVRGIDDDVYNGGVYIWTGSHWNGTKATANGKNVALGATDGVVATRLQPDVDLTLYSGSGISGSESLFFYALSPIFTYNHIPYPSAPPPMPTRAIPARRTSSSR